LIQIFVSVIGIQVKNLYLWLDEQKPSSSLSNSTSIARYIKAVKSYLLSAFGCGQITNIDSNFIQQEPSIRNSSHFVFETIEKCKIIVGGDEMLTISDRFMGEVKPKMMNDLDRSPVEREKFNANEKNENVMDFDEFGWEIGLESTPFIQGPFELQGNQSQTLKSQNSSLKLREATDITVPYEKSIGAPVVIVSYSDGRVDIFMIGSQVRVLSFIVAMRSFHMSVCEISDDCLLIR
jgi:hypothetical protein